MAQQTLLERASPGGTRIPPWPALVAGLGLEAAACLWSLAGPDGVAWRALVVLVGLLAVGAGLVAGLRSVAGLLPQRAVQAGMAFAAALACLLGAQALLPAWDSLALFLHVACGFGVLGGILLLLPWAYRALAVSLLAVFHLLGIFNAFLNVPPMDAPSPWLSRMAFFHLYRPWQQFTNLTNGYHFYAPEPGPVALVYFRVEFADGSHRWVRLPDHSTARTGLDMRRTGALATSLVQSVPVPPARLDELYELRRQAGEKLEELAGTELEVRRRGATAYLPPGMQYREPGQQVKMQLGSYARYVARTTTGPKDPAQPVTGVKIYSVSFHNPSREDFVAFKKPRDVFDPTLYSWYYVGEYGPDGELKPSSAVIEFDGKGVPQEKSRDPFLYWMLPVLRRHEAGKFKPKVIHFARIHAGDTETETNP